MSVKVIVISGSMGSGKTTVLGEASDILSARGVVHAAIDLDAIGSALLPDAVSGDLTCRSLAAVWANFASAGVNRLLLAEAVETRDQLDRLRRAVPDADLTVCRLTADVGTLQQRIRVREPGMLQQQFVARARELQTVLDAARVEDFAIANENRSVTEVARELLERAGWLNTAKGDRPRQEFRPGPVPFLAAVSPYRARLYRLIFTAAAAYNIAFGVWAALQPLSFFARFDLAAPLYPSIWACLGMVVGLYGLGYAYAAWHLDRAAPFIAIGLLGKLLGPAGWVLAVTRGEWPIRTIALILFNDVIWWAPFALFLLEGTRVASLRRSAPYVCAALNLAAFLAMASVLRFGTEIVPLPADRVAYIAAHPALWRGGWILWVAAAVSLVAFYAWWGGFLRDATWALGAVAVACAGLACDLCGESLLIGWLPRDYDRIAPAATLLTGAAANGLYTLAGIGLTVRTPSLNGFLRTLTWTVWLAGGCVSAITLARAPIAIAISTTVLFVLFCPWVMLLGRALRAQSIAP